MSWLYLAIFGATGVLLRAVVSSWFATGPADFPTSTLIVNAIGSLIAGFLYGYGFEQERLSSTLRIALLIGFCGGFTTFSSFAVQLVEQVEGGRILTAWVYGIGTPVLCVVAAWLGLSMARNWF